MTVNAKTIYDAVATLGIKRAQVRSLLPEWWDVAVERAPSGVSELAMLVGRRLSLDVPSLMRGHAVPRGAVASVAYKHRAGLEPGDLSAASMIASSLAQTVLAAMPSMYRKLPSSPAALRREAAGDGMLGFDSLLSVCWDHGIPVIPLPHLPVGVRKMDGAALQIGDRPVVVIAKKKSSRAWLSFILAHEIGHIAKGHLRPGSTIVDVSLQESATYATDAAGDAQEAQADEFALELMGGGEVEAVVRTWSAYASPVEIAVAARAASQRLHIEAGHFILRQAFLTKRWAEAVTALRFLSEDFDPESALLGEFKKRLDLDSIAEDMQDLVTQITGWDGSDQ